MSIQATGKANTLKRYSIAAVVVLAIIVASLTLCASSGRVWADDEMITPQWVDDFGKGQTDGKVPPEVKTQEKKKPIGGCTKTNKDGSQEWDVVYHDDKTGETTTIYYIKTKDKAGKPKTVWKIKVEKPGQPPKTTTYDPEPGNPTKTEQVDDKTPTSTKYDPAKDYASLDIGYGPGVTIGEPPEYVPPSGYTSPTTTEKTGGGGGGTTEKGGGPPPPAGGGKGGGIRTEGGGGGGTTTETGGGGGGTTTETGGGGGKTTREKVPPPKKPKEPPLNLKLVTYGGPPREPVIHLGEKPPTTPQEYVHKNPTPTWDHGDGGDPKIPVEPTHPVPGEIITEHKIPHNDKPHVTETVKIPGDSYTETTRDGWINIGSGWAYTRIPVRFVEECVGQTQEKVGEGPPPTTTGGGTTTETTGGGNTEEPPSTQEAAKKLAKQKEALNPPPPGTQTKDDCGPWDGKYDPNGEGQAIKNSRYDVARFEKEVANDKDWRNPDPDIVECIAYEMYDVVTSDKLRHDQDQLTRSKWQVEIYEAAYMAARARGICNESAHFYGATAYHDWLQKVQWDFINRMTLWLQALGSAIMAQQVAQDIAANFGEISKAKDATAQRKAFDESVARVKARNAAAESGGGGASSEGAGGAGRTGKGGTQVLGPGENPNAMEYPGGKKGGQSDETQTLPPGEQTQEKTQTLPPGEATEKNFTGEKPPACKPVKKGDGGSPTKEKLIDELLNTRVRMDEREKNMKVIKQRLTEDSNSRWLESEGRQPPKEWRRLTPEQRASLEAAEAKMIQENGIDSQKAVDLSSQIRPPANAPLLKPDGTPVTGADMTYHAAFGQWPPPGWPP